MTEHLATYLNASVSTIAILMAYVVLVYVAPVLIRFVSQTALFNARSRLYKLRREVPALFDSTTVCGIEWLLALRIHFLDRRRSHSASQEWALIDIHTRHSGTKDGDSRDPVLAGLPAEQRDRVIEELLSIYEQSNQALFQYAVLGTRRFGVLVVLLMLPVVTLVSLTALVARLFNRSYRRGRQLQAGRISIGQLSEEIELAIEDDSRGLSDSSSWHLIKRAASRWQSGGTLASSTA